MLTKIAHSQDQSLDRDVDVYLALKPRIERSQRLSGCQDARTPYSFIHSPHSFLDPDSCCKSCIRCTATTEPWLALWAPGRIWDRTGGLQVDRHTYTNKHVNITHTFLSHSHSIFFMFPADWQLWPTCIIEGEKKKKESPFGTGSPHWIKPGCKECVKT